MIPLGMERRKRVSKLERDEGRSKLNISNEKKKRAVNWERGCESGVHTSLQYILGQK